MMRMTTGMGEIGRGRMVTIPSLAGDIGNIHELTPWLTHCRHDDDDYRHGRDRQRDDGEWSRPRRRDWQEDDRERGREHSRERREPSRDQDSHRSWRDDADYYDRHSR